MTNTSPDRDSFQYDMYVKKLTENPEDKGALAMIDWFTTVRSQEIENLTNSLWQKDNMAYDLRSTPWICDKAKASAIYAQNLYSALCNNEFIKNEVWSRLQDKRWSCSWRSAGGVVSDMLEVGDYIDWYCSGSSEIVSTDDQQHIQRTKHVAEGQVTDEINNDLFKLGWLVVSGTD